MHEVTEYTTCEAMSLMNFGNSWIGCHGHVYGVLCTLAVTIQGQGA